MTDSTAPNRLWRETPLVPSHHISEILNRSAYLKLDMFQPSQSFKYRGISHFGQKMKEIHGPSAHFVIASSGNAGLAAAMTAKDLGLRCTVYLHEGVSEETQAALRRQKAEVIIVGKVYLDSLQAMRNDMKKDPHAVTVPAYDDPLIWEGHASMIQEIREQLVAKPDVIFCSVGGGGLLGGVLTGCRNAGWDDIPIVAIETHGSNCFYQTMAVNTDNFGLGNLPKAEDAPYDVIRDETYNLNLAHLHNINSCVASLGATSPAAGIVRLALDRTGNGRVKCVTIADDMTMWASKSFADDHKIMAELSCAATLAPAYNKAVFDFILPDTDGRDQNIVFVVCGGIKVSVDEMVTWNLQMKAAAKKEPEWKVTCNGRDLNTPK
ncbi:tryptophan synthase beta subunit-like PLP-dependent enzyme [Coniophora puteana RWD-64-598 SS2]|uniref:L-serine ammonia-lyase n=1 Tax=Coniophora puteana (strain RWD-64-598) TaxID=741705 RepID=A0A5M3N1K4_CONPW|nr:tryptophan synthase beta subunit-like PLP-dependent enzyme [Coniophora puteana RWD-64-598 SS2]EIW85269.1 tryptophan synthase beta subunit-like PLP-dependent enzyme [Coniophora puteana RWD-64-598 SS2]